MTEQEIKDGAPSVATHIDHIGRYWDFSKMLVFIDGDWIYFGEKLIEFVMGSKSDYWLVEDVAKEFKTLEQAIQYCMEN